MGWIHMTIYIEFYVRHVQVLVSQDPYPHLGQARNSQLFTTVGRRPWSLVSICYSSALGSTCGRGLVALR